MLVDEKLDMMQQFALKSQRANHVLAVECGQQAEGGDCVPLLCSGETSTRVVCPVLGPSKQRHGPDGASHDEGHKDQRAEHLPYEDRLRELFSLGRRTLLGHLITPSST